MIVNGTVGDWRLSDEAFLAAFRLPAAADKREALKETNPISREDRISFDEVSHTYTVDGIEVPTSVTKLLHEFCHDFDPHAAIAQMRAGDWETKQQNYLKPDGVVMREEEIVAAWARNGEVQRARGQLLHYHCEQFLNGCVIEEPRSPEFEQWLSLYESVLAKHFQVFRTEVSIFHCGLRVAGQIDCLCRDREGYVIWDWKRSKRITMDCSRQMKPPLQHLPDCNYYHYALQLNLYRFVLESEYDYRVNGMFLGVVHPLSAEQACIEIPRLDAEIALIVEHCGGRPPVPGPNAPFVI